jgi:hypothetical protein
VFVWAGTTLSAIASLYTNLHFSRNKDSVLSDKIRQRNVHPRMRATRPCTLNVKLPPGLINAAKCRKDEEPR